MKILQCALVGMHFRPPAAAILARLQLGTRLELLREPGNPYDPAAVQVWLDPGEIPAPADEAEEAEWEAKLAASGSSAAELAAQPRLQLGYLGAAAKLIEPGQTRNSVVAELLDQGATAEASLTASVSGKLSVRIVIREEGEQL